MVHLCLVYSGKSVTERNTLILIINSGPFSVANDGQTLILRENTWNQHYHLMFIDNPGNSWLSAQ